MVANRVLVAGLLLAVGGCGTQLEKAERVEPTGPAFSQELYGGYVDLARSEYREADYSDSDVFAGRARNVALGSLVEPEKLEARNLPEDRVPVLAGARERLVAALQGGASEKIPAEAAKAQVAFDCWMQEQEENRQPNDIAACQSNFTQAIAAVEEALAPPPAPVAAAPEPRRFMVMYDFDATDVTGAEKAKIDEAMAFAASLGDDAKVTVNGYADRAGSEKYNDTLARLRADLVADSFRKSGLPASNVAVNSFGEDRPAMVTADGIKEAKNRRVEIVVTP